MTENIYLWNAIFVLITSLIMLITSYSLDNAPCSFLSHSGFGLIFGFLFGVFLLLANITTFNESLNFNNDIFFDLLLPPIIYEAGFSLQKRPFFGNFGTILVTAIGGTIISTVFIGSLLFASGNLGIIHSLTWIESYLFASLISAVDPVATLACFNKLNAPSQLFNVVFGESVLNDAVSIVLFEAILDYETKQEFSFINILQLAGQMIGTFLGSLTVSIIITLSGAFLLKRKCMERLRQFPVYEISLCLIFSLITYFSANLLDLSGILALFFSGILTAHYHLYTISKEAKVSFIHLLHMLSFICENFVFVYMGISIAFLMCFQEKEIKKEETKEEIKEETLVSWWFIFFNLSICLIARILSTFPLIKFANYWREKTEKIDFSSQIAIWFSGLRGAIAFALSKRWNIKGYNGESNQHLIISTTLVIVLFTNLILGGLTGPLLRFLKLVPQVQTIEQEQTIQRNTQIPSLKRTSSHFILSPETLILGTSDVQKIMTPRPQFKIDRNITLKEEYEKNDIPYFNTQERNICFSKRMFLLWKKLDEDFMQVAFGAKVNKTEEIEEIKKEDKEEKEEKEENSFELHFTSHSL